MKLDGFGIAGYRSFGPDLVHIKDLGKINVFIGKNNSGKSNILRFCKHLSTIKLQQQYKGFDQSLDYCVNLPDKDIRFAIQIKRDSPITGELYNKVASTLPLFNETFPEWKDCIWFTFSSKYFGGDWNKQPVMEEFGSLIRDKYAHNQNITNSLASRLLNYTGGSHEQRSQDLARVIVGWLNLSFQTYVIEAFRQITIEVDDSSLNGKGLIKRLREIQSPELSQYQLSKDKFTKISNFVKELLGEEDAYIEIPAKLDDVYVAIKGKILPLHSLGTGIHELIILAAAVTVIDDAVFCIEEPEIHLHPELQKKFVRFIAQNTNNQYLIATHSNAFFDMDGVNIYHCRLKDQYTVCDLVNTEGERHSALTDLGYKPSDILQSNFIIWVEGPSDRIYLNHWLQKRESSLIEGLHYTIMFYGGRLLSHLSFDNPEVKEFIQLCKLNRNAAIVIDSDKRSQYQKINATKQRIIKDFQQNNCFVWVTKGKEIENYMNEDTFYNAINEVHSSVKKRIRWDRFADMRPIEKGKSIDKVSIARKIALQQPDYSVLDLDKQITMLIKKIRDANA
ncbi:MAG: hypothetical protein A2W05_03685 [Candidatus Schekmanbacteria bacterium RBG_16_38_10]|uniref:Endonuclease GajA/Old nuclease/RecF-like AAA domain-containing protein n=1 Tax=Candidatus Schekmanbacteria bacterium RBG_16_38_10 TaxID=1817879 RepID=A0A1F7RYT4_9BACT|nr:MAG: hypothetical protein A2W05_03685 [Candidatus Schekmanbacteria bacterium RBG_16_38_10]